MMRNFLCSAFLTSALAADPQIVAAPSLQELEHYAEMACGTLFGHTIPGITSDEDFYNAHILEHCENSTRFGSCRKNIEDLKSKLRDDSTRPELKKQVDRIDDKCSKYVDIVVELSSSKSRIYKITSDNEAKDVKLEEGKKVQTWVDTDGDTKDDIEKGLGGACNFRDDQQWSSEWECQKHIDDITKELNKLIDQKYAFRSLRFLATAGLRQSAQKLETFDKLKDTIGREIEPRMPKNSRTIEYRPLSGEEEAENEFLATMMLLRKSSDEDTVRENQPLGIMGFGGGSLQYGMLTPTEATKDQDKSIQTESAQGGLDKVFVDVTREGDACQIEYGSDEDIENAGYATSASKYDACKRKISEIFSMSDMFPKKAVVQGFWENEDLPLYVMGGITHAIKDHFGKSTVWNYNLGQLEKAAKAKCTPYVFDEDFHNKYSKQLCTKYAYLVHVLTEFGIPEDKVIRFRKKIGGEGAEWVRSAVIKENFFNNAILQPFDTRTITREAVLDWEKKVSDYENAKASALASETLI